MWIILTNELSEELVDKQERAIILENTVVLLAGLIPWNTAMVVPLRTLDVGIISGFFAFYLYFLKTCFLTSYIFIAFNFILFRYFLGGLSQSLPGGAVAFLEKTISHEYPSSLSL